jgi:hypothetical protein
MALTGILTPGKFLTCTFLLICNTVISFQKVYNK